MLKLKCCFVVFVSGKVLLKQQQLHLLSTVILKANIEVKPIDRMLPDMQDDILLI